MKEQLTKAKVLFSFEHSPWYVCKRAANGQDKLEKKVRAGAGSGIDYGRWKMEVEVEVEDEDEDEGDGEESREDRVTVLRARRVVEGAEIGKVVGR